MNERPKQSWEVTYPDKCVRYVEAFRRHFWDHAGVCGLLHDFFQQGGGVRTVCELGSGAGTNMLNLAAFGYDCRGYDANSESVEISTARSHAQAGEVDFTLLDFTRSLPDRQFDAVLSLFVPISLQDMETLAHKASAIVRPGGYFACMLLAQQPEFRDHARERKQSTEFLTIEDKHVLRFNFYQKNGHQIDYEGVYVIGDANGSTMAVDRDTYDLIEPNQFLRISRDLYRFVKRERIYGKPDQCPPMTFELLDIYQRI